MEHPKAPKDIELKNIIDKLAQFVARNGPDFEQMTKSKQKGNAKFSFLFGGEHYEYYQYKVQSEQSGMQAHPSVTSQPLGINQSNPAGLAVWNMLQQSTQQSSAANIAAAALAQQQVAAAALAQQVAAVALGQIPNSMVQTIDSIKQQQQTLQEQTTQSEQNLNAQHVALLQQQQVAIEEAIRKAETERLEKEAESFGINFNEFNVILQPIIDTCTKDSISNGKAWILQRATSKQTTNILVQYLLHKVIECEKKFHQRLHIIYLVNDILHHCSRKHIIEFMSALESVVVPMFCLTSIGVTEEQQSKLTKLLNIWESKNNYFSSDIVSKLKDPVTSWQKYKDSLQIKHPDIVDRFANQTKTAFQGFQAQHVAFVHHTLQQIQTLEVQKQQLEAEKQVSSIPLNIPPPPTITPNLTSSFSEVSKRSESSNDEDGPPGVDKSELERYREDRYIRDKDDYRDRENYRDKKDDDYREREYRERDYRDKDYNSRDSYFSDNNFSDKRDSYYNEINNFRDFNDSREYNSSREFSTRDLNSGSEWIKDLEPPPPPTISQSGNGVLADLGINFNQPPPGFTFHQPPPNIELPDITRPPPGFPPAVPQPPVPDFQPEDLLPSLPYYDLPAGLMVPLVKLDETRYRPLNPEDIRLPPPAPPSERLLAAVKAFYSPPDHDHPRDSEGWEKLGLYEYFKAKTTAKKNKEIELAKGLRELSRSPTPVRSFFCGDKTPPPKRRYSSRSRSKSRERTNSGGDRGRRRNNRKDRSPKKEEKQPPPSLLNMPLIAPPPGYSEGRDTPSPPTFGGAGLGAGAKVEPVEEKLGETNKGHQLLKKMGWGGAGLGANEQGIEAPISGGEVREKADQYKGIGININDPYENFRKSKGQAFITRMKARAEERVGRAAEERAVKAIEERLSS